MKFIAAIIFIAVLSTVVCSKDGRAIFVNTNSGKKIAKEY